ncbi:unnamed protein product [Adineta steineri]|uniref:Uncharacterized protein n=1 Tax=Adineta steineri TaxID=433720 RepID=A0A815UZA6_9BILA|nr:unnamed protein product [Adineta steineri]CAF1652438.1 unnamed protein product [Adineta steineri]
MGGLSSRGLGGGYDPLLGGGYGGGSYIDPYGGYGGLGDYYYTYVNTPIPVAPARRRRKRRCCQPLCCGGWGGWGGWGGCRC